MKTKKEIKEKIESEKKEVDNCMSADDCHICARIKLRLEVLEWVLED